MGIGKQSDFVIYQEEFNGGMYESLAQFTDAFNAGSRNALRMVRQNKVGDYNKEAFFDALGSLISRRDMTSVATVADTPLTQSELIGVKINRKIGPVAQALGALKKIAKDQREMSFILGQMIGEHKAKDMLNTTLLALEAALAGQAAIQYDHTSASTGETTLTHLALVRGLAKMGDRAQRIVAWVMHSKPFYDLCGNAISDKITNVADVVIYSAMPGTLNRPVIVTDSPALINESSGGNTYNVLGLVPDAAVATESEEQELVSDIITGLEQLSLRIQGEYAFNLNMKGFAWDVQNGGANPTDNTVGTSDNWDKVVTDNKDLAGVHILVDEGE